MSRLADCLGPTPTDDAGMHRMAALAFHDRGYFGCYLHDARLTDFERQVLTTIGERLYGLRPSR